MLRDGLWKRLRALACLTATQDRTLLLRNVRQESLDQSGQAVCLSLVDYVTLFMRHMALLAHDNLAEVVYSHSTAT